ncbi:Isoflavone reductase, partial [Globisporangium splendens]
MRVAILGAGALAQYLADELPLVGHELVVFTRSHKAFLEGKLGVVDQFITDYSNVDELASQLEGCDAIVSAIGDFSPAFLTLHQNVLAAAKSVASIKRFIANEYTANLETHPEYSNPFNAAIVEALRAQDAIEWTTLGCGLYADYLIPRKNRHLADMGPLHPLDHASKVLTVQGSGDYLFSSVALRDVARAIAHLLTSTTKWRPFIQLEAEQTTWHKVAEFLKTRGSMPNLTIEYEDPAPLFEILASANISAENGFPEEVVVAEFKLSLVGLPEIDGHTTTNKI